MLWEEERERGGRSQIYNTVPYSTILDEVVDDYGVRRGQQGLETSGNLRELHPGNLKYLSKGKQNQ